ncbi:dTMP kinase [Saccharothrix violaceirubra]|uniref:Thymidylate kinase n=1 Tax=Saccharothrix violaceirubra TaxID=413306 RepID=A0A7W7T370_9PSEU|nr:deoxynucleoside kinase [Saccharothrix violaceirubra]MBB4965767.1 dTMP kinase [Saccharothrix violaceirubra]
MSGDRGRYPFIAIEGTDGSGKSTLRTLLNRALAESGHRCFMVGQHSWLDVAAGRVIQAARNQQLGFGRDELTRAYAVDKFLHLRENIAPALDTVGVLADRFVHSDVVYHDVLYGIPAARTLDHHRELGTRMPDVVLFVDTDPDVALDRIVKRNKAVRPHETQRTLRRLHAKYLEFFATGVPSVARIDNNGSDPTRAVAAALRAIRRHFPAAKEVVPVG